MESQLPIPAYAGPPPFSPPLSAHRSSLDLPKPNLMDIDLYKSEYDRSTRAASVLSGMSMEDMEAAETLNSLHTKFNPSPVQQQPPPTHVETTTSFDSDQPEPLLRLVTSQYPLAGSLINGSLSAYKTTQSYIPGAEWTERHVGLPIAGTVARISGVEGGLRWALQPRRDGRNTSVSLRTSDVEKGLSDTEPTNGTRRISDMSQSEILPVYNPGDRSPPYSEHQVVLSRERESPATWRQQLVISTSGLGIAMSEESLRSLRFCLSWLRWANGRLGEAVHNIKALLERYEEGITPGDLNQPMSVASITQSHDERRQAALSARVAALKKDVLETLKQVVGIVSQYAGGALPENARNLVHRHLTSLPQRFTMASAMVTNGDAPGGEAANSANRVMVLAQEGLDMMTQVSRVVNDTLVSAEGWCEKLGRGPGRQAQTSLLNRDQKQVENRRSQTISHDTDVKMEM